MNGHFNSKHCQEILQNYENLIHAYNALKLKIKEKDKVIDALKIDLKKSRKLVENLNSR